MVNAKRAILPGIGAVGLIAGSALYFAYRRQRREYLSRLWSGSRVVLTARGPIEYMDTGRGPVLLVSHGGGDGYDLGWFFSWPGRYRTISPSRPGYLRTPLETGPSPEEQADAFAALLDQLDIDRVAMLGVSAGGPVALQFALRHPQRCWALALISAISQPLPPLQPLLTLGLRLAPYSDFLPWLILNTPLVFCFSRSMMDQYRRAPVQMRAQFWDLERSMFPFSLRLTGLLNDLEYISSLPVYPLDRITAPTLVIHGDADTLVPFSQAEYSASRIPNARLVVLTGGDHLAFGTHHEQAESALLDFLQTHAPQSPLR